jgi:hypothetical protein
LQNVPVIAAFLIVACLARVTEAVSGPAKLQAQYDELSRQFARANPGWRPETPQTGALLFVAPDQYSPVPSGETGNRAARNKHSDALFELAKQAAETGQSSLAFQWTTEALRENPNHADARRVLGYLERSGKWLTPYGAKMLDAGKLWDAQKGWIATKPSGAAIPDSRLDSSRHADIKNGWQIRTDHFL